MSNANRVISNTGRTAPVDTEVKPAGRPNLRHYHRVSTQFDATISSCEETGGEASRLKCQLTNLSRAGVMAVCTPDMVKTLLPGGAVIGPRQSVRVKVQFEVPVLAVQKVQIGALCDVVYLRRISRDIFHLGMSFVSFDDSGQDCIDQYIDRKLHRPGS